MPLGVTWELHGKPLAPKMHPGQKKTLNWTLSPPRPGTIFGTFSTKSNLWSVAVLGHSASWSLVVAKGQRGSGWELVTPCARSAVADINVLRRRSLPVSYTHLTLPTILRV